MTTARDILQLATERTDRALRGLFDKSGAFIRFASGHSATIENETTQLVKSSHSYNPFPMVAMFTEGVTESSDKGLLEFRIPKIAIVIRTLDNTTEVQKIDDSFRKVVVVKDVVKPYMDDDGILTMGLFDFLLDPGSLDRA